MPGYFGGHRTQWVTLTGGKLADPGQVGDGGATYWPSHWWSTLSLFHGMCGMS